MPEPRGRFEWVVVLARIALIVSAGLLLLGLAAAVWVAAQSYAQTGRLEAVVPQAMAAIMLLVLLIWLVVLYGLLVVTAANEQSTALAAGRLARLETLLDQLAVNASQLIDLASLTDQAKRLIYREHEAEALGEAVHHDLAQQDFDAAAGRIAEIARLPGFSVEVQRLRNELEAARKATHEEQVDAAVARVQQVIDRRDWARALREARELVRRYPRDPKIQELPRRIEAARNQPKRDLLQQYGEAVRQHDIDRGVALLRELDTYLTPQEAAALAESARGVFRAKLHNLGVQFALSVTDQRWSQAVAVGEQIVREYPNSRMAQEVREKMDLLKARATGNA